MDIDSKQLEECRRNFQNVKKFSFYHPQDLGKDDSIKCDLVLCTEVLEHVDRPEEVLDEICSYCAGDAVFIISVPIEIGLSLFSKQVIRFLANLNGKYGYPRYSLKELMEAGIFCNVNSICRKGHKGFDFRKMDHMIRSRIVVEVMSYTPFPWNGSFLNTTVYWKGSVH